MNFVLVSYIKVYVSDTEAVEACIRFVDDDDDDDEVVNTSYVCMYMSN